MTHQDRTEDEVSLRSGETDLRKWAVEQAVRVSAGGLYDVVSIADEIFEFVKPRTTETSS